MNFLPQMFKFRVPTPQHSLQRPAV